MHVAQFVHRYPPALGGAEAWAARLSRHLVSVGHSVSVWTTTALDLTAFTERGRNELPPGAATEDGVTVRRFQPSIRWPGRRYLLKAASLFPARRWQAMTQPWAPISLAMWRAAGHRLPDLGAVHAIGFPYAAIAQSAERLARHNGVPFVVTPFLHLGDPTARRDPIRRAYTAPHLRRLLRAADRVIVQTPTEARAVEGMNVPTGRIVIQGMGVDPAECSGGNRVATRERWGIGPGEIVVGHLANLSREKGTIDLLRSARDLRAAGLPIRVVLAGPRMPGFDRFWAEFGRTAGYVTLLGPINDAGRRDFFAALDLFALPSRSDSFGLVLLEAWANARPVVAYRAGGVVDVVRNEVDGCLVSSVPGLSAAIARLYTDPATRAQYGEAGLERLPRDFYWADKLRIAADALSKWR